MISQHWHGESWSAAPGVSFSPHRGHSFDLGVEVETLGRKSQCCLDCFQSGTTKTEPASRRSLCHRGSCLWTRWRTSLAGEPGWGHSLQPNNGNFVNLLNKISWSMSVKPVQHLCLQWTSLQLHRWLWKLQFHFLWQYFSLENVQKMLCFSIFETIGVVVDELNGFLEGVNTQNTKHWSKNLLFVGLEILDWNGWRLIRFVIRKKTANLHVRFHFRDDWRPTEVSIRVAFHLNQGRMKNYEIYSLPWFPFHPIEVPLPHPQQTETTNVNFVGKGKGYRPGSAPRSWLLTQVKWPGEYLCWLHDLAQPGTKTNIILLSC